jgi:Putative adhesin
MTEEFDTDTATGQDPADVVRQQSFDAEGPVEVDLGVGAGRIEVRLVNEPGVHVEVRHDPSTGSGWMQGMSSLLTWVSGQFGDQGNEVSPAEAVRQIRIDFGAGRLVVRTSKALPLRTIPISVSVRAPFGSNVTARGGSATIAVTGSAGKLDLTAGSGELSADRADGTANVTSGSGSVRLGAMLGGLRARTGTGDIEVTSIGGPTSLFTGSGDVWLGAVSGDVMVRTGSGDLTVADASSGQIELQTGSGSIKVGVRAGSAAEVDLSSATGDARSELPLASSRPESAPSLRIHGRTGSGAAVVSPSIS